MIVVNGYIKVVNRSSDDDFDENGMPIEGTITLGNPIPCNFQRNSYEKKGTYDDGVFTMASYIVLIKAQKFQPCTFHLYDLADNDLGEYNVHEKGILLLQSVDAIQLTI